MPSSKEHILRMLSENLNRFRSDLENHFLCPICLEAIPLHKSERISAAHIVPDAAGGRIKTYLCKGRKGESDCNSRFGQKQDKWFGEFIRLARDDDATIFDTKIKESRFVWNGVPVNGEWLRDEDGGFRFDIHKERNSPETLERLMRDRNKMYPLDKPPKHTVQIETPLAGETRMIRMGFLTAGFLMWFRALGYSWALQKHLESFRKQILNPQDDILADPFMVAVDEMSWSEPWIGVVSLGGEMFLTMGFINALVLFPPVDRPDAASRLPADLNGMAVDGGLPIEFSPKPYYGPSVAVSLDNRLLVAPDLMMRTGETTDLHFHFQADMEEALITKLEPISDAEFESRVAAGAPRIKIGSLDEYDEL